MRKTPRQARSKATVERILTAGRQVLVDDGYESFSTNRVAAAAGISPGSLYQYFSDKASILDIVISRYWEDVSERTASALALHASTTGTPAIRSVADALLAGLEQDPTLLRVLTEELPASRNRDRHAALVTRVRDLTAAYLHAGAVARNRPDAHLTAWVLVVAMENIALRWVLDRPPYPREAVLEEMVALTVGYLSQTDLSGVR
ncbi:TetR/AcrR family transcriptional regulator [Nocardioides sp. NPDC057772]|uniref:TetR/AcrR family transcriptional regulator n=1 Tax=Nocardioides sp. NPDC057772 TaxID=3346245 RepID=UPI00366A7A5F